MIKTLSSKISAVIGMGIALVSFGFFIASMICSFGEPVEVMGVSREEWMRFFGVIAAGASMVLYVIDAIYCAIRFFMKTDRILNGILTLLILGGIPMIAFVGSRGGACAVIWNVYFLGIFVVEAISLAGFFSKKNK
jgi:CDP-diglyceride synthetase